MIFSHFLIETELRWAMSEGLVIETENGGENCENDGLWCGGEVAVLKVRI